MAKLSNAELARIVRGFTDDAVRWSNTQLAVDRNDAIKSYLGEPYGNEVKNRSQVVTQDVLETVEWMMPSLIRIFTSGDKAVKFEPTGPEDEQAAEQETEVVNLVWTQHNRGFQNFYDAFKDALLQKLGVFKVAWIEEEDGPAEEYEGLNVAEAQKILEDQSLEIVEFETEEPDEESDPALGPTYSIKVKQKKGGRIKVEVVPPEEFLIERNCPSLDRAQFVAQRTEKTISQVRAEGWDVPDDIGRATSEADYEVERQTRFRDEGGIDTDQVVLTGPNRKVWVVDAYVHADRNGDGASELLRVVMVENDVVEVEEVSDHPFATVCPVPMPHKAIGLSIADLVMDIQLIKTTLVRQLLDNLYLTNMPRNAVQADALVSIDEMLEYRPGGIVRTTTPPAQAIMPMVVPFVAADVLPVLETFEEMKAARSGVTKYNQGLDADTLNKTAHGIGQIMNAAQARIELVARIFAETGVRDAFLKVHKLLRTYSDSSKALSMKLAGAWVQVNPREWKQRTDMSVSVGLGTGDKQQMLGQLMGIAQLQEKIIMMQGGAQGPLVTLQNVYSTASEIVVNAGLKSADKFFTNPIDPQTGQPRPQPPAPPSPEAQAAMAAVQVEQAKLQIKQQEAAAKIEADKVKNAQDIQLEREKAAAQIEIERMKAQAQIEIDRMKAQNDFQVKQADAEINRTLKTQQAESDAQLKREASERDGETKRMIAETRSKPEQPQVGEAGMVAMAEGMKALAEAMTKSKKIIRGPDGRAAGIE